MRELYTVKKSIVYGALVIAISFGGVQGGDYGGMDPYGAGGVDDGMDAYGAGDPGGGMDAYGAAGGMDSFGAGGGMDAGGGDPYGAGGGMDPYGAAGGIDTGGGDSYGAGGGMDVGGGMDAYGEPQDAQQQAPQAFPMAANAPAVGGSSAVLKEYFNTIEDDLLLGDSEKLKQTCQMKQGGGCGAAKNFLSACTLFLKDDESFGTSACLKQGSKKYKMNPDGFVYAANPQKNKEEETAIDHLVAQMKEHRKKLAPDKAKFLKIVCTTDALSMLENKEDKLAMEEACLDFKYGGNPPPDAIAKLHRTEVQPKHKGKKHRKPYHPRHVKPTIIEDKESPEEDVAPVKHKKVASKKAAKETAVTETVPEGVEGAPVNVAPEPEAVPAEAVQDQENMDQASQEPLGGNDSGQGFGQVMSQAPQMDLGKAFQAGAGLVQQMDKSGKGQQAIQGLQSFSAGLQGRAAGGGLGALGGMGGGGDSEEGY